MGRYFDENVIFVGLCVLNKYIKVAIIVKNTRVNNLVFGLEAVAFTVLLGKFGVSKLTELPEERYEALKSEVEKL